MRLHPAWLTCAVAAIGALAGTGARAAQPGDFRNGLDIDAEAGRPLQELALPDAVYAGATRADLGDIAVFNAQGTPVAFALCAPPAPPPAAAAEVALNVFPLQAVAAGAGGPRSVAVDSTGAVTVTVTPAPGAAAAAPALAAYVIDARKLAAPPRAVRVGWHAADGASEVRVSVEASDDLDRWRTLVPQTALVRLDAAGQTLERLRIELPPQSYAYLRLRRTDPGPAPVVDSAVAEVGPPPVEPPLSWFDAAPLARAADGALPFDAAHQAPVSEARVTLPVANAVIQAALESRPRADAPWRMVWSGAVFDLGSGEAAQRSADPRFPADTDRYWQLRVLRGAESLGGAAPRLALGYAPARLRFTAQGSGRFLLAYGSARSGLPAARGCAELVQGLPAEQLGALTGAASAGALRLLGGDAALVPAPHPPPTRLVALWALLVLGAAALLAMSLNLLRTLRRPP